MEVKFAVIRNYADFKVSLFPSLLHFLNEVNYSTVPMFQYMHEASENTAVRMDCQAQNMNASEGPFLYPSLKSKTSKQ